MAAFPMFFPPLSTHPYFNATPGGAFPLYQPQYYPGNPAHHAPKPPEQAQQAQQAEGINTPAGELATMSMKIAQLESDLHHCLAEKTKAKLADPDVTQKGQKRSTTTSSSVGKMQVAYLEKELARVKRMNISLKARLGQTQTLLYKLTSLRINPKDIPSRERVETSDTPTEVPSDEECLIDLLEPAISTSSASSGEGTTAVEASTEGSDYSKDESRETEEVVAWPTATTDSLSSISSSSSYIQRFVKKPQEDPAEQPKGTQDGALQAEVLMKGPSVPWPVIRTSPNVGGFVKKASSTEAQVSYQPALVKGESQLHDDSDSRASLSSESLSPCSRVYVANSHIDTSSPTLKVKKQGVLSDHGTWKGYLEATRRQGMSRTLLLDDRNVYNGEVGGIKFKLRPSTLLTSSHTPDEGRLTPPNLTNWAKALRTKGRSLTQELRWAPEVAMPCHGLRPRCDFFQSNSQSDKACEIHKEASGEWFGQRKRPEFFSYGIRYLPSIQDENVFRTVLINGLAASATAFDVLRKVRGGLVLNLQLLPYPAQGKIALVTFREARAAAAYADFAEEHHITILGKTLDIHVLSTPTWPTSRSICDLVLSHGATRCFNVIDISKGSSLACVQENLKLPGMTINGLECPPIRSGGTLHFRFTSIRFALRAFELYAGRKRNWASDPCAQPLETLLDEEDNNRVDSTS